jgi:hypothetical protein
MAPELRTAKRSPPTPQKASPLVAPYSTVLPTMMFCVGLALHMAGCARSRAARQALADVVVGVADQLQRDAMRQESAERLPAVPVS